jgi:hypothetical protein
MKEFDQNVLTTLSKKANDLRGEGFTEEFIMTISGLKCCSTEQIFSPADVKIIKHFRFEGNSDPGDMSILYAVETVNGLKGSIAEGYGPYSDSNFLEFIQQVEELKNQNNPKGFEKSVVW